MKTKFFSPILILIICAIIFSSCTASSKTESPTTVASVTEKPAETSNENQIVSTPEVTTQKPVVTTPEVTTHKPVVTTPEITTHKPVVTTPEVTTQKPVVTTPEVTTQKPVVTTPEEATDITSQKPPVISPPTISELISNKSGFSTTHTKLYNIPATESNRIMQGGCTDGKHMYFAMVNSGSSQKAYIYKYDIETNSLVKKSALIDADHANDMTYNPKTNELIVVHNSPNRKLLSVLDPDTLEFKRQITLDYEIYSISYQPERDVYVVGISYAENFTILDADFKLDKNYVKDGDRFYFNTPTGYTKQSVECDYDYIYFVLYKKNVITVFNWQGEHINTIPLSIPVSTEPENISIVNGKFYIGCNNSNWTGGELYEVELTVPKE